MAVATKTLGVILNAALKEMGEPEITEISSENILQQRLIESANNAVREMVDLVDYDWRLKRLTISTNAEISTESAAVTNGDATVSSVTDAAASATNFGSVTTSMWFRAASTQKSYQIATATSSSQFELETAYLDSTSTAIGYRIFQDTYPISTSGFGEIYDAMYGDSSSWVSSLQGGLPDTRLSVVPFSRLMQLSGGDRHRDTSGKPRVIAQIAPDSSDNPQFVLWPYPDDTYLIEIWYTQEFAENATFSAVMFGADAPSSAYDFIEHKVVSSAHQWDENPQASSLYDQKAQVALNSVIRRENRERIDQGLEVNTYRRRYGGRYPTRSGIGFNTVSRRR
jgi:hypothetical protein